MKLSKSKLSQQKGFTLLEAMVAMVVFSVGLLGLGALQMAGMTNNQSSLYQSIAAHLAYDMSERIRSNTAGKDSNFYDQLTGVPNVTLCNANCSGKQIADTDHFRWGSDIRNMLPGGNGTVLGDGTEFTITVMWDAARNGAAGTGCNPAVATDLKCLRIFVRP